MRRKKPQCAPLCVLSVCLVVCAQPPLARVVASALCMYSRQLSVPSVFTVVCAL